MWRPFQRQQGAARKRGDTGLDSGAVVPLGMGEGRTGVVCLVADDVVSIIGEMCVM